MDTSAPLHGHQHRNLHAKRSNLVFGTAAACVTAWTVFRGALGIAFPVRLASRLTARAAGGALCGIGLATFSLLLSLYGFAAATLG